MKTDIASIQLKISDSSTELRQLNQEAYYIYV